MPVTLRRTLSLALVACVVAEFARTQDVPASVSRRSVALTGERDSLEGGGANFAVRFDRAGMRFAPALGARASKTHELALTLDSIRRGDRVLHSGRDCSPARDGTRATYRLSGDISERYSVRPDGVELSYRFAGRIGGSGDLVVRLRVDSSLASDQRGVLADGLGLHAEGLGGVRIGGVTGVDAAGLTAPGSLEFDGDYLELSLPDRFVEQADYPLVLDPLIGTELLAASGGDDGAADVAYDATNDVYLVAWQRRLSSSDADICAQRVGSDGSLVGGLITVFDGADQLGLNPTVGNNNLTNRFLVAWQRGWNWSGPWDVHAACVDAATGTVSAPVELTYLISPDVDPDAASDHTLVDDGVPVVWRKGGASAGIYGMRVRCPAGSGPPILGTEILIDRGTAFRKPAISQKVGDTGRYLVTYVQPDWAIQTMLVDRTMSPISGLSAPATFGYGNKFVDYPDVDGERPRPRRPRPPARARAAARPRRKI